MFYIIYWNNDLDKQIKIGNLSHEQAIIKQAKLQKQGHNNVQIKVKGIN